MNLGKIYQRSRLLIINPSAIWQDILAEKKLRRNVILDFLLPMSLLIGISSLIGTLLIEGIEDGYSFLYLLFSGIISFTVIFLEVYISGWLITEIALSFNKESSSHYIFNLVVYSHVPFYLTLAFTRLFPQLIFLNILGVYSFFLFWTGIEHLTVLKTERKPFFLVVSVLVMLSVYLLLSVIFNSIYDAVLEQFTTFNS